ncbi:MAG: DUF3179 domain-containing protein [Candidatus Aenigmarchaeota archaeon]|nr:DUF3179 domain-containing protein [Candidatus Aenigmarchaeota archaeon]
MDLPGKEKSNRKLFLYTAILVAVLGIYAAYSQMYPPARAIGGVKSLVNISELSTALPEGAIPEINNPVFLAADNATYPHDSDIVVGVVYNGIAKAYPLGILTWHEVINDNFSGKPVAVTYCVFCRTAIAYESKIAGKTLTFKVTGLLYNANDLLVDIQTRSYWQQITGEAVMGDKIGRNLTKIPTEMTTWGLWKARYPETLVMSTATGFDRDYGVDPYGGYEESENTWYFPKNEDRRLSVKEIVYGVAFDDGSRAYPKSNTTSAGVINDAVGRNKLLIVHDKNLGTVKVFDRVLRGIELNFEIIDGKIIDTNTKSVWDYDGVAISGTFNGEKLKRVDAVQSFWYVWAGFYPKTGIFRI